MLDQNDLNADSDFRDVAIGAKSRVIFGQTSWLNEDNKFVLKQMVCIPSHLVRSMPLKRKINNQTK